MSEDPKKKAGDLKAPLHLVPTVANRQMAFALNHGAEKYGVYNWRESEGIKATTYIAALKRHTDQFTDGEDADDDSNLSHLAHIMATCAILLDAERVGKLIDDRPVVVKKAEVWEPPCLVDGNMRPCNNAKYPIVCESCVSLPTGWTNFVARRKS